MILSASQGAQTKFGLQPFQNLIQAAWQAASRHLANESPKKANSVAIITQAGGVLLLRLAERFTDFQAKETKKHAGKRLPESIRKNAARLDALPATITVCDPANRFGRVSRRHDAGNCPRPHGLDARAQEKISSAFR